MGVGRQRSRSLFLIAAVMLALLAGCGGGQAPATTSPPTTGTATTTAPPGPTTNAPTTTPGPTTTSAPGINGTIVKQEAMTAIPAVDTYRVALVDNRTIVSNAVTQRVNITSRTVFNRSDDTLRVNRTARGPAGTAETRTYVVGETLYKRNPAYLRRYDSKWVKADLSENFSTQWRNLDTLTRQRIILNMSTVTATEQTTVDGRSAVILEADVNESAYNAMLAERLSTQGNVSVSDVSFTYWIAEDTGLPLRTTATVNSTVTTSRQHLEVHEEISLRFGDYGGTVDVTLPDAASTAVAIGDESG